MKPEREKELANKVAKADKAMRVSFICFLVATIALLIFVVIQQFSIQTQIAESIKSNQRAGAENHKRTQQYVKCIANVLMKPLSQRTPEDFDACGLEGTKDKSKEPAQQSTVTAPNYQPYIATPLSPITPIPPQPVVEHPVASAPPEPGVEDATPPSLATEDKKGLRKIPVIDRVLTNIGL